MSVKIKKNLITLTRGDTMRLGIIMTMDGTPYEPEAGDTLRFTLKRNLLNAAKSEYVDPEPLIEKTIPIDTLILELEPEDTKGLGFGTYAYDIQITFADGAVDTFLFGQLVLTPEVD